LVQDRSNKGAKNLGKPSGHLESENLLITDEYFEGFIGQALGVLGGSGFGLGGTRLYN
jgi:hypothetical protein